MHARASTLCVSYIPSLERPFIKIWVINYEWFPSFCYFYFPFHMLYYCFVCIKVTLEDVLWTEISLGTSSSDPCTLWKTVPHGSSRWHKAQSLSWVPGTVRLISFCFFMLRPLPGQLSSSRPFSWEKLYRVQPMPPHLFTSHRDFACASIFPHLHCQWRKPFSPFVGAHTGHATSALIMYHLAHF